MPCGWADIFRKMLCVSGQLWTYISCTVGDKGSDFAASYLEKIK